MLKDFRQDSLEQPMGPLSQGSSLSPGKKIGLLCLAVATTGLFVSFTNDQADQGVSCADSPSMKQGLMGTVSEQSAPIEKGDVIPSPKHQQEKPVSPQVAQADTAVPMQVNSKEWWEYEFQHNWEVGIDGKLQTDYFMRLLFKNFPNVVVFGDVLDWGCALGQGAHRIKELFPACHVEGYDFSETAITRAKKLFPEITFSNEIPKKQYDFVITSNCIEHFKDPVSQLKEICKLSKKYVIVLAPYNQAGDNPVHPAIINEKTFPVYFEGFRRMETKIIPDEQPELGGDLQIAFIYGRIDLGPSSLP